MTTHRLVPAYGRDYASSGDAILDLMSNKDFLISDSFNRYHGMPINLEQMADGDRVVIRYARQTRIVSIDIDRANFREEQLLSPNETEAMIKPERANEALLERLVRLGYYRHRRGGGYEPTERGVPIIKRLRATSEKLA